MKGFVFDPISHGMQLMAFKQGSDGSSIMLYKGHFCCWVVKVKNGKGKLLQSQESEDDGLGRD